MKHEALSKTTIEHLIVQEKRLLARQESHENLGTLIDDEKNQSMQIAWI
jgi:hypothetical protein